MNTETKEPPIEVKEENDGSAVVDLPEDIPNPQAEEDEMEQEYRTYFPVVGDSDEVIAQKRRARELTTDAMIRSAGPVYAEPVTAPVVFSGTPRNQQAPANRVIGNPLEQSNKPIVRRIQ